MPATNQTSSIKTMIHPELVTIANNGRQITATNYWGTALARAGAFLVSFNAGEARLLVPRAKLPLLDEFILNVHHVVLSTGYWRQQGKRHSLEWLAEDESDCPFSLIVGPDEIQGLGHVSRGENRHMTASIWTEGTDGPELQAEFPAYLRSVSEVPCLRKIDDEGPATVLVIMQ